MTSPSLEARRRALRSEIAVTRGGLAVQVHQLRGDVGTAMLVAGVTRLLPGKWRWLAAAAAAVAAGYALRQRARGDL